MRRPSLLPALALGTLLATAGCRDAISDIGSAGEDRVLSKPVALADYLDVRQVTSDAVLISRREASFSHDEKLVAYLSDAGGQTDVWVQTVEGGEARQITHVEGQIWSFDFSPTQDHLIYEVDHQGNSQPRLYMTDSHGNDAVELLPDLPSGSRTGLIRWAEDGTSFLYITAPEVERVASIFKYHMASGHSELLWTSTSHPSFSMASPDLQTFIFRQVYSLINFNLYQGESGGDGQHQLLTPHEGEISYTPTSFSQDSKTLYYISNQDRDFSALYAMDLGTRETRVVLQDADWDVEDGVLSRGGRYFHTVVNVDGTPRVQLTEVASGKPVQLPTVDAQGTLVPVAFSSSDRYLVASLESDTTPRVFYLIDLEHGQARPMMEVLPVSLRDRPMVRGEVVRIPSDDGLEIPALLYRPAGEGPFPAVIEVHDGPNAQAKRSYSGFRQYLVDRGYTVLVPNVRGSTGYGRTFTSLAHLDLGGGPLRDVVASKRWLVEHAEVDGERVAIMGEGYGGYMALAAATFTPTEFAAHVDFFGISDMKTLVEAFPPYWRAFFKAWGDPDKPQEAAYQAQHSPIHFVDRIERPVLVVQGEHDPQVPREQSEKLVAALKGRNIPVTYLLLADEGHGFSDREGEILAYLTTERFLRHHLLGEEIMVHPSP